MLKVIEQAGTYKDLVYSGDSPFPKNQVLIYLRGPVYENPTRESIQIAPGQHIDDEYGQFINHACEPSCRVEGDKVISIREINEGDSITFDYNSNEDVVINPFHCHCHNRLIRGRIREQEEVMAYPERRQA